MAETDKKKRPHRSKADIAAAEERKAARAAAPPLGFTDGEDAAAAAAGGKRPKAERPPTRPQKKIADLRDSVVAMLALGASGIDALAHTIAAKVWTAEDRLSEAEVALIAGGIAEEIMKQPKLAQRIAGLAETKDRATLALVFGMIAIPRLARHGALPRPIASAVMRAMGNEGDLPPAAAPATPKPGAPTPQSGAEGEPPIEPTNIDTRRRATIAPEPPTAEERGPGIDALSGT